MKNNPQLSDLPQNLAAYLQTAVNSIALNYNDKSQTKFTSLPKIDNRHLLVGLSGGPDSTALLIALSKFASSFDFRLTACHINHGLRADESEMDAQFCQKLCHNLNIDCQIIKLPPIKSVLAEQIPGQSLHINEATLRTKRYEQLSLCASNKNISFLLTAHTLDDQTETLIFRLLRGTGPTGLRGMEFCRQMNDGLFLLRPLLKCSKTQCQEYLASQDITARQDSSNSNEIYSRNYIRHTVLPTLAKRFPDFSTHLESLREIITAENDFLEKTSLPFFEQLQSIDANSWSVNTFISYPLAIQRRILSHALKQRSIELSFKRLDEIISLIKNEPNTDNCLNLNTTWRVRRLGEVILWQQTKEKPKSPIKLAPIEIKIPGLSPIPDLNLALLVEPYLESTHGHLPFDKHSFPASSDSKIFADLSLVQSPLVIRQRRPGDRINPLGMSQSVQLKKYIHTHKRHLANNNPHYYSILLADQNEVLWLPGIGISEKIKVRDIPSHVIQMRATPLLEI